MNLQTLHRLDTLMAGYERRHPLPSPGPERGIRLVPPTEVRDSLRGLKLVQSSDEVFVLVPRR